jgi:transcriptional regulator with XRE-family HTH domain
MPPTSPLSFAARVRDVMAQRGLTSVALAKASGLTPSLVSRLTTETDKARREPQIEHIWALARGLEVASAELVTGTDAESVLRDWIPRAEFEKEVQARYDAQKEASGLRTDLAGLRSEIKSLAGELDQMSQQAAQASQREIEARREQASLRIATVGAEARLAGALQERDQVLVLAQRNYNAWAQAQAWILDLQRQAEASKGAAWLSVLLGAGVGALLRDAASDPKKR